MVSWQNGKKSPKPICSMTVLERRILVGWRTNARRILYPQLCVGYSGSQLVRSFETIVYLRMTKNI